MYATGWRIEGVNNKTGPNDTTCHLGPSGRWKVLGMNVRLEGAETDLNNALCIVWALGEFSFLTN